MQRAIELTVNGQTIRGMEHIPSTENGSLPQRKAPAVVIFHGFTGSKLGAHRMYVKLSRMLESIGYASFRFDFAGSGESDGQFEDMTLSSEIAEAQVILDFVRNHDAVNPDAVSLFGHSLGGVVASIVAAANPTSIDKLMLLCAAGNMSAAIGATVRQVEQQLNGRSMPPVYDNEGDLVGLRFANEIMKMDLFEAAKGYSGPVLLIHGTNDEAVPVEVSSTYKEQCYGDNAGLLLIDGADHSLNGHEWEAAMISGVRNFLQ